MRPERDPADVVPVFAERGNDFGTYLETADTDGGADDGREPRRRGARLRGERASRLPDHSHQRAPPARVNSRYRAGDGVREQHRNAIGGLDGDAGVGGTSDQRIPRRGSRVPRPIGRYLHAVAVYLPQGMEDLRTGGVFKEFQISIGLVPDSEKRGVRLPVPNPAGEAVEGGKALGYERFDRLFRSGRVRGAGPELLPTEAARKIGNGERRRLGVTAHFSGPRKTGFHRPLFGEGRTLQGVAEEFRPLRGLCRPEGGVPGPSRHPALRGTRREGSHPDGWGRRRRGPAGRGAGLKTGVPSRRRHGDVEQCAASLRFAHWCRPEVGAPSRPRAFSRSMLRGLAALRAAVPV